MRKSHLINSVQKAMFNQDKKPFALVLYIHMPTGETEMISNPNIVEKLKYIDKTYNEDLIHSNCPSLHIEDFKILYDEDIENEANVECGDTFGFEKALEILKHGGCVARDGWNGKDAFLMMFPQMGDVQIYEDTDKAYPMQEFIAMKTVNDTLVPWVASQTDMLAIDWRQV